MEITTTLQMNADQPEGEPGLPGNLELLIDAATGSFGSKVGETSRSPVSIE